MNWLVDDGAWFQYNGICFGLRQAQSLRGRASIRNAGEVASPDQRAPTTASRGAADFAAAIAALFGE